MESDDSQQGQRLQTCDPANIRQWPAEMTGIHMQPGVQSNKTYNMRVDADTANVGNVYNAQGNISFNYHSREFSSEPPIAYRHFSVAGSGVDLRDNEYNQYGSSKHEFKVCHRMFKTSDYEIFKDTIAVRAPGTCRWLLDRSLFRQWQEDSSINFLWVTADEGCGKSVLAKTLVDIELPNASKASICYFFFRKGLAEQEKLSTALCAILHQLFSSQPALLSHAVSSWHKNGERVTKETGIMWNILKAAALDDSAHPIICVIDALDECSKEDQERFAQLTSELVLRSSWGLRSSLKVLVTSRPYQSLFEIFERHMYPTMPPCLRGEDFNGQLRREVSSVIKSRVAALSKKYELDEDHQSFLLRRLLHMEQRTYLWWSCVGSEIDRIYSDSGNPNEVDVDLIVRSLPHSVEDAYECSLGRVTKEHAFRVKTIFQLMLGAFRPLTVAETACALEIVMSCSTGIPYSTSFTEKQLKRRVRFWCANFIYIAHNKLYFIHASAREFLLSPAVQCCNTTAWKNSIALADAHKILAIACSQVDRMSKKSRFLEDGLSGNAAITISQPRLLSYAAEYGLSHAAGTLERISEYCGVFLIHKLLGYGLDLKAIDTRGRSLLHIMIGQDKPEYHVIETLLNRGGMVLTADAENMNCLHRAVIKNDPRLVDLLLSNGFPIDKAVRRSGGRNYQTARAEAKAAEYDGDANRGLTALHAAVLYGHLEMVNTLITRNANVMACDHLGRTALHLGAGLGIPESGPHDAWDAMPESLFYRLWDNTDPENRDSYMHMNEIAPTDPSVGVSSIQKLCEASTVLAHMRDSDDQTALHFVKHSHHGRCTDYVSALLASGADSRAKDKHGITPIHLAAQQGDVKCLKILVPSNPHDFLIRDSHGRNALHHAVINDQEEAVKYIIGLENEKLSSAVDHYGQNALQIFFFDHANPSNRCVRLSTNTAQHLLAAGTRASVVNQLGQDALAHAIVNRKQGLGAFFIEMLLQHGGNPDFQDDEGKNLSHHLVSGWVDIDFEALMILENWDVPLNSLDSNNRNILHQAAINGTMTTDFLCHMKQCVGLNFAAEDNYGKTAEEYAKQEAKNQRRKIEWTVYARNRWKRSLARFQAVHQQHKECRCSSITARMSRRKARTRPVDNMHRARDSPEASTALRIPPRKSRAAKKTRVIYEPRPFLNRYINSPQN